MPKCVASVIALFYEAPLFCQRLRLFMIVHCSGIFMLWSTSVAAMGAITSDMESRR